MNYHIRESPITCGVFRGDIISYANCCCAVSPSLFLYPHGWVKFFSSLADLPLKNLTFFGRNEYKTVITRRPWRWQLLWPSAKRSISPFPRSKGWSTRTKRIYPQDWRLRNQCKTYLLMPWPDAVLRLPPWISNWLNSSNPRRVWGQWVSGQDTARMEGKDYETATGPNKRADVIIAVSYSPLRGWDSGRYSQVVEERYSRYSENASPRKVNPLIPRRR